MSTLQILIVDDERLSRRRLCRLLSRDAEVLVAGECETPEEARSFLIEHRPDVMFLDVQMPEMDGFAFLESVGQYRPPLLKPFDETRLLESVNRVKAKLPACVSEPAGKTLWPRAPYRDRLAVRCGESLVLLRTDQVDWIEAADNYVDVHCGHQTHTLRETMNALEKTLDPLKFVRIHRSAMVNLDRIQSLQPWFRGDYRVVLSTGTQLTLSRSYRHSLQNRIMNL